MLQCKIEYNYRVENGTFFKQKFNGEHSSVH